ncbi:MAG TPA: transposase [Phycisphaerae bacterium]|nr:transposase [Phycisphaerae bacterium]
MDGPRPITIAGIEVPAEERTPLMDRLLRVVEEQQAEIRALRDEIARLKGLPPRPTIRPSTLNAPHPDPSHKKRRRGKRPGSAKRHKTAELTIHQTIPVPLEELPEGTQQNGYEDFVVQDLKIEAHNVRYRRLRYLLPNGTSRTAPLPAHVDGHCGPGLRAFVLYQYHQNHVTQPLIHEQLLDLGIDISTGQIDRLLTEGHEQFHEEKDALLPAAREVSSYFQADDTSARHLGKNAYTTVIANPLFASFTTTQSKSRVNFLKLLRAPHEEYVWNEDALRYAESQGLSLMLRARLAGAARKGVRIISSDKAWERQLAAWKIRDGEPRRIVTEAALFGTLMHYELYVGQPLVSDDAGQFKISSLLHALCWLHAERSIRKLVPMSPREQEAIDDVRDAVWKYYQRLRTYRESPSLQRKAGLERDFDRLFRRRTGFADLNAALRRIHAKRNDLLLVLDRPEIPLHNNLSESDIREWAKKRKISAGTRSELGRRCRDTFISLKKTCRKLGVSFWRYLQDRIRGLHEILALPDLIRQAAPET